MSRPHLQRAIATYALVMAATAFSGCHNPYQSGMESLAEGQYLDAEKQARELLNEEPNNPEYHLLLADALVGKEAYREAESHARVAFESGKLNAAAGRTLGKVLWELGQPVAAVEAWRTARASDTSAVSDDDFLRAVETALAMAVSVRDFETALELRSELKELDPKNPAVGDEAFRQNRIQLAEEWVRAGRLQDAVALYTELAEATGDETYEFERARLLAQLGEVDAASKAFLAFVDAGPDDERVDRLMSVARRAERIGTLTVAVDFYDRAINAMGNEASARRASTHLRLAALLFSAKATDEGRVHLQAFIGDRKAIEGEPVSAAVYLQAAQVASRNRAPQVAIDLLEEAIVVATPNWRATRTLAELHARRAQAAQVERVLKKYVERSDSSVQAQVSVGRWAAGRRSFELARFFLESASQSPGATPTIWLELARVYSALGRMDEVRRALSTYVKKVDDKSRALLDVAGIYRGQRMYEEAEEALLQLFKKDAKDLTIARQLETLYNEWGQPKKIHGIYDRWIAANGKKAGDYMIVGERFQRQNDWDDALPYFHQAARRGENDAWLQIADIYKRQRRERDMKEALDKYLAGASDREPALNAAWQRYKTSAWSHEAIPILEELIQLDGKNVLHYESLSTLYFEQGRDVEAFELWKRYIELSDNPIASLETMARRFERRGHHEWMLTFLHQILEKHNDPEPRVYRLLGDAYHSATSRRTQTAWAPDVNAIFSEQDKAKRYYRLYLEKAKPNRRELQGFAESMRQKRIWDVAAKAYEKLDLSSPVHTHQLLHFGAVLLHLGRAAEAEGAFAKYYERRGESVDAARAIADELAAAERYDAMEPYLKRMMEAGDENMLRAAFMLLGDVYRQTDRTQSIVPLISEYLAKTQNPSEARRTVLNVLENAGMWDEGVKQLERLAAVQGDEYRFELGIMLYRRGDKDEAEAAFRDFASASVTPAEAWLRVARFYENHADAEIASDAYNLAVSSAAQNHQILTDRGRFRVLAGRIEDGRADFDDARELVGQGQKGPISRIEVQTLLEVGRYADAREAARAALSTAYLDRDFFFKVIAASELNSGDDVRMQRMVDELRAAGIDVSTLVQLLEEYDHLEAAAEVIEEEIARGDLVVAGQLVVTYANVFSETGGIERLMRVVQPLLDGNRRDGRLAGQVGEYLLREGHPERGVLLLHSAIDRGETSMRPLLARAYLQLGHYDEASRLFQAHVANVPEAGREFAILYVATQYELLNERPRFVEILEELAADSRFAAHAVPILLRYKLDNGEVAEAVASLERLWNDGAAGESEVLRLNDASDVRELIAVMGVQTLASEGYTREALSLLERVPAPVARSERVRDLRLRLANAAPETLDLASEVQASLDALGDSSAEARQKLRMAWLVMLGGHLDLAQGIAEPFLTSGDIDVAAESLRVLLGVGEVRGDRAQFETWTNAFIGSQPDKVWARSLAADQLRWLGADDLAARLSAKNLERVPTEGTIRRAFYAGQLADDRELIAEALNGYWRVAREPANDMPNFARSLAYNTAPSVVSSILDPVRSAYPDVWSPRRTEIALHYRSGKPERARDLILEYLEDVSYEAEAVESVFGILASFRLWGDLARLVAPEVPDASFSARSRALYGRALLELGDHDEAISQLDSFVESAADSSDAAAMLASDLLQVGRDQVALRYAELSVQKRPARKNPYLYRGMARLANGDVDGAREDFDRSLNEGLGRHLALYWIGRIALRTNQEAIATEFLEKLAYAPPSPNDVLGALRLAIAAFRDAGRPDLGIAFVERRWPELAAGQGMGGESLIQTLAGLYELAGKPEVAFSLYDAAIHRALVSRPFEGTLNTYRNNLAYTYSTTNQKVGDGLALVRLAIVGDRNRNDSFIDTVGWLHFRNGDLEAAEEEVRRAIRTSNAAPRQMTELIEHLAEIRQARGYARDAVWLQIFVQSIKPD